MSKYRIHLTEYLEQNISNLSDKTAVIYKDQSISFSQLHQRAVSLAKYISKKLSGINNSIIAVYLPKSIDSVIADLAILYSANAYMNLDVNNPNHRIKNIVSQVKPSLVITKSDLDLTSFKDICMSDSDNNLDNIASCKLCFLDCIDKENDCCECEKQDSSDLIKDIIDTDPCCVINTSGSTGVPKAVILNHRSFIDFVESIRHENMFSDSEIIGSLSPYVFDIYSFELCMMMAFGSTLVIIPENYSLFPVKILNLIKLHNVTYIFWVPTIMVNIANMDLLSKIELDSLKMIWFAGEVFPTAKFNYWYDRLNSHCRFMNFYGPIEITLDCLFYEVKSRLNDNTPIPIGKPFRNTAILVLDEHNKKVKSGCEGELCIRGSSLAMGYYNDPEKTSRAFVQNPLNSSYPELIYRTGDVVKQNNDGNYVYVGRKDTLIKRFGYRIELSEIEHVVVNVLKMAKNCCVVYQSESKDLYLVYEHEHEITKKQWYQSLMGVFPKYMIPNKFIRLDELPRNLNGKIDRNLIKSKIG